MNAKSVMTRGTIGLLIGMITCIPMFSIYTFRSPYFLESEFIAYRVGDALKLKYDESFSVRPVQGIPTAFIAKTYVATGELAQRKQGLTRDDLNRYARFFFALVEAAAALLSMIAWLLLPTMDAILVSVFMFLPWLFGVASLTLLLAPDYWIAEWLWLTGTLIIIARRRATHSGDEVQKVPVDFLLGAWMAIGASTKISLLGAFPLLFFSYIPGRNWRDWLRILCWFGIGLTLAYVSIVWLYMGSVAEGSALLRFQTGFFRSPNTSVQYTSWIQAIELHKETAAYLVTAVIAAIMLPFVSVAGPRRIRAALYCAATVLWLLLYFLMFLKRPHDSTLTSISISAAFLIVFLLIQFPPGVRSLSLVVLLACLSALAWDFHFPAKNQFFILWDADPGDVKAADRLLEKANGTQSAIWFVPNNFWNAVLPPQLMGYNGGMGGYVIRENEGDLYYDRPNVFQYFWPRSFVMGSSDYEIGLIAVAVKHGATVFFTRQTGDDDDSYVRLASRLRSSGFELSENLVKYDYRDWHFGQSVPHQGPLLENSVDSKASVAPVRAKIKSGYGYVRLRLRFPVGNLQVAEPIITTGVEAAGDIVYVVYSDSTHIRLGFDHWFHGGPLSDSIPINYAQAHEMTISMGSLLPMIDDRKLSGSSPESVTRKTGHLRITLDGTTEIEANTEFYSSLPENITIGENLIHGSTCNPSFTGTILSHTSE